jgi:hypothetical protein
MVAGLGRTEMIPLTGLRAVGEMVIDSWAASTRSRVSGTRCRHPSMRNGEPPRRPSRSHCRHAISASTDTGGQRRRASSLAAVCAGGRSCGAWPGKRRVRVPTLMPWRRYASVNGLEICYFEIRGAGDPLVLPYGAFGTIWRCFDSSWFACPMRLTDGQRGHSSPVRLTRRSRGEPSGHDGCRHSIGDSHDIRRTHFTCWPGTRRPQALAARPGSSGCIRHVGVAVRELVLVRADFERRLEAIPGCAGSTTARSLSSNTASCC